MSPNIQRWLADTVIIIVAVCLFLPVYISHRQYAHSHVAAADAFEKTRAVTGSNYGHDNRIFADMPHNRETSPEFYYCKREAWGRFTFWLFLVPLGVGVGLQRWAACVIVVILWMLSSNMLGVRY